MKPITLAALAAAIIFAVPIAWAQKPVVYPAKGQSAQQKQKDDKECMSWAKSDTGIDPVAAAAPAPQQTGPQPAAASGFAVPRAAQWAGP
jgi:hypothetical protein